MEKPMSKLDELENLVKQGRLVLDGDEAFQLGIEGDPLTALIEIARAAQECINSGFFSGTFHSESRDELKTALEKLK